MTSSSRQSVLLAAGLALAGLAAAPAQAQSPDTAFYVGIGGGGSHISGGCSAGISCDNNDTAFKLYGGWRLPGETAIELTYYDLGKFTASAGGFDVAAGLKGQYWGVGGAWRPAFAGTAWGGVLRAGAAYNQSKLDVTGFSEQTRDSWHPYLGLGLTYAVSRNIKVEADYDWTRVATEFTDPTTSVTTKGTTNASMYMIGATFEF